MGLTSEARRVAAGVRRRWDRRGLPADAHPWRLDVVGIPLWLADVEGSVAVPVVAGEVGDGAYDFSDIDFRPGDVVVDLGAHVGVVSTYLGTRFPFLRIVSFEPVPQLFALLQWNLARNRVRNVTAVNKAVTGDGRPLGMVAWLESNSGGGTSAFSDGVQHDAEHYVEVASTTLDRIFEDFGIDRCRLLKIDVEGAEYEILSQATCLDRVEHVRGEFHENNVLRQRGDSMEALSRYVEGIIGEGRVRYSPCEMQWL